jgi:hypothetical protein
MKPLVQCRCGHNVLGREILRTDLYERSAERDLVYVRFRCARCRRLGQAFIPEREWDWSLLEEPRGELSGEDRDRLIEAEPISGADLLSFHSLLSDLDTEDSLSNVLHLEELSAPAAPPAREPSSAQEEQPAPQQRVRKRGSEARRGPLGQSRKSREARKDARAEGRKAARKEGRKDDPPRPASADANRDENDCPGEA